ncbi:aldehyde dehydrogenase family protein [Gordonia hirsuta]|uniref:aldehyde dehydrogenase family protein n=1 Tax=Gordonia hirsuta TaxID=53427 RepID=UPI0009DA4526|nr:aldehyde dehydrogenase family protein [Gordonia hirsuta]
MTTVSAPADATTGRNYIAGEWSDSGELLDSISPSTGQVLGSYRSAGRGEALAAIAAARRTFDETDWSRDPRVRSRAISELADRLEARVDEVALSLSRENGKRLPETTWEVSTTVDWFEGLAGPAQRRGPGSRVVRVFLVESRCDLR